MAPKQATLGYVKPTQTTIGCVGNFRGSEDEYEKGSRWLGAGNSLGEHHSGSLKGWKRDIAKWNEC